MTKLKRIVSVLSKGGFKTFWYLAVRTLKSARSEQKKYDDWRAFYEPFGEKQTIGNKDGGEPLPFFSVVFSGASEEDGLKQLKAQSYTGWELLSPGKTLQEHISGMKGGYLVCVQGGTTLPGNALERLAAAVSEKRDQKRLLFYADEDCVENGKRTNPFFKPEYSPDTLRSFFYMGGMLAVEAGFLQSLKYCLGQPVTEGGYLLALEASFSLERGQVCHIPEVLSHRGNCFVMEHPEELKEQKERLFQYYQTPIVAEYEQDCGTCRVVYLVEDEPLVSVIIPSKDNPEMIRTCLRSLRDTTDYNNMEIIVIDNGSSAQNRQQYERLSEEFKNLTYAYEPEEFNFSKMCNSGVAKAKGTYLLFVNDDIEFLPSKGAYDWMRRMLGQAMQPHTGAVGVKLLYPNTNKIQHVGLINYEGGAAHVLSRMEDDKPLLQGRNRLEYNYSFVTGACLLLSREKFEQAGGFEEKLAVTFNDTELCIRLLEMGYYNVVRNDVVLYHHESITRGVDAADARKYYRSLVERTMVFDLHPDYVKRDLYYSPYLNQKKVDGSIRHDFKRRNMEVMTTLPFALQKAGEEVVCHLEYLRNVGQIEAGGFIYDNAVKNNNHNQCFLVLKNENGSFYVKTQEMFNPTIAPQMQSEKSLNFTEFYASFSPLALEKGEYEVGVAVKTGKGKAAKLCMCGRLSLS